MHLSFEHYYQSELAEAAALLKDYLVPGTSLRFGRRKNDWFWEVNIPGPERAALPSAVSALARVTANPGPWQAERVKRYQALVNRPFKKGPEPFSRTIGGISDLPLESLFALIAADFQVCIAILSSNSEIQPGMRDSAQEVCVMTDHPLAAERLARWFDAAQCESEPRRFSSDYLYAGTSELHFLIRVPVYHDTVLPQLGQVPGDIIAHVLQRPSILCRGMLVAGLSGSGKTTTVKKLLAGLLSRNPPRSLLITDLKGEYAAFSAANNIEYLRPGADLSCLRQLDVNPFIPLDNLPLQSHIDILSLILGIGGAGGGGPLLPSFLKILLEEFYFAVLWPKLTSKDQTLGAFEQRLAILNMSGKGIRQKLADPDCLDNANYQLINFWKSCSDQVIGRLFRQGGRSNSRAEIEDVLSSRMAFLETSVLAWFSYRGARSFDALRDKKIAVSLRGLSRNALVQLMSTLFLLLTESILADDEQESLRHLFVIEEAHHLAASQVQSTELLTSEKMLGDQVERALVEGRSRGMSLILTEQQPGTRLLPCIAANTTLKICHNLLGQDGRIMAETMGLPVETSFATLAAGEAFVKAGDEYPAVRQRIRLT